MLEIPKPWCAALLAGDVPWGGCFEWGLGFVLELGAPRGSARLELWGNQNGGSWGRMWGFTPV